MLFKKLSSSWGYTKRNFCPDLIYCLNLECLKKFVSTNSSLPSGRGNNALSLDSAATLSSAAEVSPITRLKFKYQKVNKTMVL